MSQPPQNPYDPQQPYGQPQPYGQSPYGQQPYGGPWMPPADHPSATTVLILGIVGLAVCQLAAPFAWVMGGRAKREIDASNGTIGGRQQVVIGYVLGIVGSVLLIGFALLFLVYLVVIVIAVASSN